MTAAPTEAQKLGLERAQKELAAFTESVRVITETEVPALNKILFEAGIGRINLERDRQGGGERRSPAHDLRER